MFSYGSNHKKCSVWGILIAAAWSLAFVGKVKWTHHYEYSWCFFHFQSRDWQHQDTGLHEIGGVFIWGCQVQLTKCFTAPRHSAGYVFPEWFIFRPGLTLICEILWGVEVSVLRLEIDDVWSRIYVLLNPSDQRISMKVMSQTLISEPGQEIPHRHLFNMRLDKVQFIVRSLRYGIRTSENDKTSVLHPNSHLI